MGERLSSARFEQDPEIQREIQLHEVLQKRGLAICSSEEHSCDSPISLSDAVLIFEREVFPQNYKNPENLERTRFEVLCPKHARLEDQYLKPTGTPWYGDNVRSEVIEVEGRFVRKIDGKIVRGTPVQGKPSEELFNRFGISPAVH